MYQSLARRLFGRLVLAVLATAMPLSIAPASTQPRSAVPHNALVHHSGAETHIRKLHLFRPDLIPYPLCYEVYC
jgi:hypothetical protein